MKKKLLVIVSMLCLLLVACGSSNKVSKTTKTLDEIATAMESSLELSDKIEPAYQMIGAIGGVKYTDSSVEIYEYDVKSDAYKDVSDDMKIKLEGFDMDLTASAVNGQYVLFAEEADNKDDIVKAFNDACK